MWWYIQLLYLWARPQTILSSTLAAIRDDPPLGLKKVSHAIHCNSSETNRRQAKLVLLLCSMQYQYPASNDTDIVYDCWVGVCINGYGWANVNERSKVVSYSRWVLSMSTLPDWKGAVADMYWICNESRVSSFTLRGRRRLVDSKCGNRQSISLMLMRDLHPPIPQ